MGTAKYKRARDNAIVRISELRSKLDPPLTQSDLAIELGVTCSTIQNWESKTRKVGAIQFLRLSELCKILDCKLEKLVDPVPEDRPMSYFDESEKPDWKCNIGEIRRDRKINQRVLARAIGLTDVTLSAWEKHHKSAEFIARTVRLCQVLKCSVHDLVSIEARKE